MEGVRSILVPSVQELAKEALRIVPDRYVFVSDSPVLVPHITSNLPQLPLIDLTKLMSKDLHGPELQNLHYACKAWGFFQLVNHGVSTSLVEDMKRCAKEIFQLPNEEKKKLRKKEGDTEGIGQFFVFSEHQKLEWADVFYLTTLPSYLRNPHLFNQIPQEFRQTLESYSAEMEKLAIKVLELMAKALAIEPKEITEVFNEGRQTVRINYYPPCPQPERVIGIKSHSDAGGLTILLQANEVEGLQIRKDGMWIPVKPLPNAFIINIGDMLEMMTNGVYRSIEHRATVNSQQERISIATFHGPNLKAIVAPAPSLVTQERPAQFRVIGVAEYFKGFFSRELSGKSYIEQMRVQNENHKST